jgi:hypothetical protein
MNWRHLAALLAATSNFVSASAEVRIIVEPHDPAGNGTKYTEHDTGTAFIAPGGTVELKRSSDTYVWVYEHGINLLPTTITDDDADVTGQEFASVDGRLTRVSLPLFTVGNQVTGAHAGARAYRINAQRDAQVGDSVDFTIAKANGAIRFKGRIGCDANANEALSALTGVTASAEAIGAGGQGSFTVKLDQSPPCQKQRIAIELPRCFLTALPGSPQRSASLSALLEASDPKQITLPIFAAAPGTCTNGGGDIKVTSNGVSKTVAVRFFDSSTLSKPKPLVPQVPDSLKPKPINPNAPATPKPKGPGEG